MSELAVIQRRDNAARITTENGWAVIRMSSYCDGSDLCLIIECFKSLASSHRQIAIDLDGHVSLVSGFFGFLVRHRIETNAEIRLLNVSNEVRNYFWFKGYFTQCAAGAFDLIDRDTPCLIPDTAGSAAEDGDDGRELRRAA